MRRYAGGDLQAFAALYARHRAALYRYLARHVRERAAADDLFQEVWSRVVAHRASYEPRAKFSTFLYRIAHNCCIDHLRRAAARPPAEQGCDEEPGGNQPDTCAEQAELLARYRQALERLPPEQRDVVLLHEQSGLSLEEIASVTGVGTETVKSRLRYALAKLRAALASSVTTEPAASKAPSPPPGVGPGAIPGAVPSAVPAARDRTLSATALPIAQILGEPGS